VNVLRIGMGYDVHKLVVGRKLILGGVEVAFEKGLLGHSDADVLVHAIMDALLGAAALGDIGRHFPDTDGKYKNISSLKLLDKVRLLLEDKCYIIENIDATIVAQKPKMAPYIENMCVNIANVLKVDFDKINIKATTTEGLGFTGNGEGISAYAVASLSPTKST
jgi:2-C-methyl-D-erythritol 2,4-cyclodiphosphate synthase